MIPFPELGQLAQEVGAILQQFYQLEQSVATANQQQTIFTATLQTESMVQQVLDTVRQIQADTQYIRAALGIVDNRLLQAVGTPQQANTPVTLPTTPPPAYGGSSSSSVADAVWNWQDVGTSYLAYQNLRWAGQAAGLIGKYTWLWVPNGSFLMYQSRIGTQIPVNPSSTPYVDPSTILATDATVNDWVSREYAGPAWDGGDASGGYPGYVDVNNISYQVPMNSLEFAWYKLLKAGTLGQTATVAPVWPGIAGVTLGAAHAITPPGEAVSGSVDGCIVDITGVPPWAGNFSFGTSISWRNIGGMSFTNDNGEEEFPQVWGFEHVIYLPKSMAHASGYVYRAAVGVSGTITPFTIN